jgi:hypothetical protein
MADKRGPCVQLQGKKDGVFGRQGGGGSGAILVPLQIIKSECENH